MFEGYTYDRLLEDVLNNAPSGIDTRPGSIFYDAVSGIMLKVTKLYADIDLVTQMTNIATAVGDALDARAVEYGVTRLAATAAKYRAAFEGAVPQLGERFYTNGKYFVLKSDNKTYFFEAEIAGSSGNDIYAGTAAVPVNNISGLVSATFGELYESGSDTEDDESIRTRVQEKIAGPAENGNKQHYKTWCESIDGIGRARIFPLWNGPNTVKAVLIDSEGMPCGPAKVAEVQEYIDPASKGLTAEINGRVYVVGDGLGNGAANIGAQFTAAGAIPLTINIQFKAELKPGASKETVQTETTAAIKEYFKSQALNISDDANTVIRISAIGAILSGLEPVLDYSDLTLNDMTANIMLDTDSVPVIGEVTVY